MSHSSHLFSRLNKEQALKKKKPSNESNIFNLEKAIFHLIQSPNYK